ncbi:hypothetical protein CR513_51008, partial [Mucuna pruriens]
MRLLSGPPPLLYELPRQRLEYRQSPPRPIGNCEFLHNGGCFPNTTPGLGLAKWGGGHTSWLCLRGVAAELSKVVVLPLPSSEEDFMLKPCSASEQVYIGSKEGKGSFFYIYETQLWNLGVSLPFDKFDVDVLRTLDVAPSQHTPTSWHASLQGDLSLPTYGAHRGQGLSKTCLFTAYSTSYKGFEGQFVRVRAGR